MSDLIHEQSRVTLYQGLDELTVYIVEDAMTPSLLVFVRITKYRPCQMVQ